MRPSDIAAMCVQNLKRRRARTVLTALGVMVGTASIVIMVSIGFGLSEQTERTLAQMGDLTLVQVYGNQGGGADAAKLDDEAIQTFRHIDGVVAASGKFDLNNYSFSTRLKAGLSDRYQTYWANVVGLDAASNGASFLCYVTPAEHLRLPDGADVREGIVAFKIAAHAADIAKGLPGARDWDDKMAAARKALDWEAMFELAIDPAKARRYRAEAAPEKEDTCSMCGNFCAVKNMNRILDGELVDVYAE